MVRNLLLLSVISCASHSGVVASTPAAAPPAPRAPQFVDVGVPILERDAQARIVRVRHEVVRSGTPYVLEAEMPGGSGAVRVTSNGQVIAEGTCRDGLRDGVWTQRPPLQQRTATYVQGRLEGVQANVKPDESIEPKFRKYIGSMSGEVRSGARVGRWEFAVLGGCTSVSYGSQCGNEYCDGHGSVSVSLTYDASGGQSALQRETSFGRHSDETRPLFEDKTFPVAAPVTHVPYTCDGLGTFTGLGILENE